MLRRRLTVKTCKHYEMFVYQLLSLQRGKSYCISSFNRLLQRIRTRTRVPSQDYYPLNGGEEKAYSDAGKLNLSLGREAVRANLCLNPFIDPQTGRQGHSASM